MGPRARQQQAVASSPAPPPPLPYAAVFPWQKAFAELAALEAQGCEPWRALMVLCGVIARELNPRPVAQSREAGVQKGR